MLLSSITNIAPRNLTVTNFSGTGSQTNFTLPAAPGTENNTQVFISGVYQQKDTYSVSGTTLTFSTAPPSGTDNIEVVTGATATLNVPADGSVTLAKLARVGTAGQVLTSGGAGADPSYQTPATTVFASSSENAAGTIENKAVDPLGIREAFNATGSAPVYACRAWVNFNGTGTVAIRASGNVSSITDNGTGDYTINFITSMPDTNYCFTCGIEPFNNAIRPDHILQAQFGGVLAGSLRVISGTMDAFYDEPRCCVNITR